MVKQSWSKLLCAALTAGVIVTSTSAAYAGEVKRQTDFFSPREHAEMTYSEMQAAYYSYDPTEFDEGMDALVSLAADERQSEAVTALYQQLVSMLTKEETLKEIANNARKRDVTDSAWAVEYSEMSAVYNRMADELRLALKEVIALPGGQALKNALSASLLEDLEEYTPLTQEANALYDAENALLKEYSEKELATSEMTVEIDGRVYKRQGLINAYMADEMDYDTCNEGLRTLAKEKNRALGDVYLRLVQVRKDLALERGYANYSDMQYAIYDRGYTKESIRAFTDAMGEYMVAPYQRVSNRLDFSAACLNRGYDYRDVMAVMECYLPQISSELKDSFDYLLRNGLYDLAQSPAKEEEAYSVSLPFYHSAYMYLQPVGTAYDFSIVIHEFGHFNQQYHIAEEWYESAKIDIAETHSQGLELLFTHFYDEIFAGDGGTMRDYLLYSRLESYMDGAFINELETYVYTTDGVTLQDINTEAMVLAQKYGLVAEDELRTELEDWVNISHFFLHPCYYISYATSAAAAFEIWQRSLEDFEEAVDLYLRFTSLGFEDGFLETLEEAGLGNPLTPGSVKQTADSLMTYFDRMDELEGRGAGAVGEARPQE